MAVRLGAAKSQHDARAVSRGEEARQFYAESESAAGQGRCGHALRLYGLANAAVGAQDCEQLGGGRTSMPTSEDAERDRTAWAAVAECFQKNAGK